MYRLKIKVLSLPDIDLDFEEFELKILSIVINS